MSKLKAGLLAAVGTVVGAVTLRSIRQRRSTPKEEASHAVEEAVEEATEAVEHAAAALDHARVAVEKTVEVVTEDYESGIGAELTKDSASSNGRLRRVRNAGTRVLQR